MYTYWTSIVVPCWVMQRGAISEEAMLALIVAFIGLFTNQSQDDEPHDYLDMAGQDPKDILTSLADLLGLSAEAHGDGTPSVKCSIEHH
ncbi:unnamed protein product [Camellia sinensis]